MSRKQISDLLDKVNHNSDKVKTTKTNCKLLKQTKYFELIYLADIYKFVIYLENTFNVIQYRCDFLININLIYSANSSKSTDQRRFNETWEFQKEIFI